MIVRCPHCGWCAPARYRTGLAPETRRCAACGLGFPFFPALEIEPVGMPHDAPGPQFGAPAPSVLRDSPRERAEFSVRRVRHGTGWAGRLAALVVGLLLILTLFGQFLVHERASLAAHPEFRALGDRLCRWIPCPPQGMRHPAAIHIELLGFTDHPPGRLRVDLELHNTLARPQPWPLLQLALSDRHGRILGQGRWHPAHYRGQWTGTMTNTDWLQPGERHRLQLEIQAPSPTVDGVMIWPL